MKAVPKTPKLVSGAGLMWRDVETQGAEEAVRRGGEAADARAWQAGTHSDLPSGPTGLAPLGFPDVV